MRKVVALVGKTSVGKTTLSLYIKKCFDYQIYEVGDYVRKAYSSISPNTTLLDFANSYYVEGKLSFFLESAIEDSMCQDGNVAFVGIRTLEELKKLKLVYPESLVILCNCSKKNREKRYYKSHMDKVSFVERDRVETIWMDSLLKTILPDYIIFNDGNLIQFEKAIDKIFNKLVATSL